MDFESALADFYKSYGKTAPTSNPSSALTTPSSMVNNLNIGNTLGENLIPRLDGGYDFAETYQPDARELETQRLHNSAFDTPYEDYAQIGIGGLNAIIGGVGMYENMKNNKVTRKEKEQNMLHSQMARQDRTNFVGAAGRMNFSPSAFA